jgi:light-regulated signal transduction histidine kinase (bacteriophytochrome)
LQGFLANAMNKGSSREELKHHVARLEAELAKRKQAQQQARKLVNELEQRVTECTAELHAANEEFEAFSHSVSHDLRAPLRAIGGFSKMLLQDFGPHLPAEGQRLLNIVTSSADEMREMIDNLLKFSRLGRQALSIQDVNVSALVNEVVEELRKQESGRKVEIQIADLPGCKGDPVLLRQVFVNLLSNAIKFTRMKDRPQIEIGSRHNKREKVYFVRDNGAGFDMRYAEKLFGVFQRLHDEEQFEGTGIGLSIVQRIIQRHGGRIWAEAEEGKGATFYFALPC